MKKLFPIALLVLFAGATVLTSCSNKSEDPPEAERTLTKSQLYDKEWYNEGATQKHEIHTGGKYGVDGTWKWVNNSDTMEIVPYTGATTFLWVFQWSTETEMSCKLGTGGWILYKDHVW